MTLGVEVNFVADSVTLNVLWRKVFELPPKVWISAKTAIGGVEPRPHLNAGSLLSSMSREYQSQNPDSQNW
jgi:hypothetical protein